MPKLMANDDTETIALPGAGNFQFSAVRIEDLGASEYTLVTIVCDISGSVISFADDLLKCIKSIVAACQKSDKAENLLIRLLTFNHDVTEIHGFVNLSDINLDGYEDLNPDGYTALYDASYDAIGATTEYSKRLLAQDFDCNGAVYIITDGVDNRSKTTPYMIKERLQGAIQQEDIESLVTILVTLKSPGSSWDRTVTQHLETFYKDAGLSQLIDLGDATPDQLAKLANFVSESISSQSQALGSGAPSQSLQF